MKRAMVLSGVLSLLLGGGITNLTNCQSAAEVSDLKSLAEMYNSGKFRWLGLIPGTERFVLRQGPVANFDLSTLTQEQSAIFLGTMATVAENGVKLRTLYVWESDTDRHTYIYNDSGKILASYPPPEGYDPYILSRERIEGETILTQERRQWLIKSLDPSRVVLSVRVADGPIPISPSIFEPILPGEAPLPGGFGTLGFNPLGPEPLSRTLATWLEDEPPLGLTLKFQNPGKGSYIPIWRRSGPEFAAGYTFWTQLEDVPSDSAEKYHEKSLGLRSRYYYSPFLDTTYVQAPSSDSVTVKYVAGRDVTATVYLWKPGAWAGKATETVTGVELLEGSGIYVYEKVFSGLSPDTVYKYCFIWSDGADHTAVGTTRTWPEQQDITEFSFIVYGDNRGDNNHDFRVPHRDVACMGIMKGGCIFQGGVKVDEEVVYVSDYPRFILHTGDLVNAGGDPLQWIPHFFRPAGALISRVPVFPCVGNHETSQDSTASKYRTLFKLPDVAPQNPNDAERWYSFDYGRCHFISLDTYSGFAPGSDQYAWLVEEDLPDAKAKKDAGTLHRIFVIMHFPPYSSGPHGTKPEADPEYQKRMHVRTCLVTEFEECGVDIVFSGHEHLYERVSKEGIQYAVTGGGGAPGHYINLGWTYDGTAGAVREASYDQSRTDKGDWRHHCQVNVSADGAVAVSVRNNQHNLLDSFQIP